MDRHVKLDGNQPHASISHTQNSPIPSETSDNMAMTSPPLTPLVDNGRIQQPSRTDECERQRVHEDDGRRLAKMPSHLMCKTVSPFLKEYIPGLYAPIGKGKLEESSGAAHTPQIKDPNSKLCYRHRPDSRCRRAADETKMGFIQRVSSPAARIGAPCLVCCDCRGAHSCPRNSTVFRRQTKKP